MVRAPCCEKVGMKRGRWTAQEDGQLKKYIQDHGEGSESWKKVAKNTGLRRCGKSCRLRWVNYLKDDLRRDKFTSVEDHIIISLYNAIGSRWSYIAARLPGRTDNDLKNYWKAHLSRSIGRYKKPSDGASPSVGGGSKGKGEERSKAAKKKKQNKGKNHLQSKAVVSTKKVMNGGCEGCSTKPMPDKNIGITISDEKEELKRIKSYLESEERQGYHQGSCPASEEVILVHGDEKETELICASEERKNGLLGSYEGLESYLTPPNSIMDYGMGSTSWIDTLRDERVMGFSKGQIGVVSSSTGLTMEGGENDDLGIDWALTSFVADEWFNFSWESSVFDDCGMTIEENKLVEKHPSPPTV